jgi:hypothetical protein
LGFKNLLKTGAGDGKGDRPLVVECGRMGNKIVISDW